MITMGYGCAIFAIIGDIIVINLPIMLQKPYAVPRNIVGNISVLSKYAKSNVLVIPKLLKRTSKATKISVEPKAKIIAKDAIHVIVQNTRIDCFKVMHLVMRIHANDANSSAVPENIANK